MEDDATFFSLKFFALVYVIKLQVQHIQKEYACNHNRLQDGSPTSRYTGYRAGFIWCLLAWFEIRACGPRKQVN